MTTTEAATLLADSLDLVRNINTSIRNPPTGFASQNQLRALDEASNNVQKAVRELYRPRTIIQND